MKNNRKHPVLIPLLIVALVCTVVPTLLIATGNTEPVRVVTEAITTPVRNLFYAIGQSCNQFFSRFTEYDKLKEENDRLRQQIISMEQTLSEAEQVLERMIRVIEDGRAPDARQALEVVKDDLKKLNRSVKVSQEEYDEVVAVKPMFLVSDYQ